MTIYKFQSKSMPVLLGWGIASSLVGLVLLPDKRERIKQFGLQFFIWGIVDAIIALLALRSAGRQQQAWEDNQITPQQESRDKARFEQIVAVNALLDLGYIAGGWRLASGGGEDMRKRGAGEGIILQGAFLFVWDVLLLALSRWRRVD